MTALDLVSCPERAQQIVKELLTTSFPLDTTPISLHPICVLLRSDPSAASQLLLQSQALNLLSTLPNAIRSHILLALHHTLSSVKTSKDDLKSFASAALEACQITTFALILSRLPEEDRNEIVRDMNADITKDNIVMWLNSFSDSPGALCPSLISLLHNSVTNVYQDLPAHDYIPLIQNILQLIQHIQNVDQAKCGLWAQLVRNVFRLCPASSLSDLSFITETALSYQPVLYDIIYQQLQQTESLSAPDIMVLMCLCCSRPYIDPVLSPVFKSISSKRHSIRVWKDVIRCQGNRASLLNSWSEIWMEDNGDLGQIGSGILQCLFIDIEHSRHDVLQLILTNITEYDGSKDIQDRYISLLSKLPMQQLIMFTSTIMDFIRYSGNLQPEPAKRLLSILLPIVHFSNSALDQLILLFRKFIHSRLPSERSLGAFGLCELLRTAGSSLSLSVQLEIVSCIESSLNLPFQQRTMIYSSLRLALSCSSLRLHQECYHALFKVLDRRLRRFIRSEKGQCSLSLKEYVYVQDGSVQYHDNFPELVACHTLTIPHVLPKPTFRIVDLFFMNPSKSLALLSNSSSQRFEAKNLFIAVTFAGACETLSQLLLHDESIAKFMTSNKDLSSCDLSVYLIEVSSYVYQTVSDLSRTDVTSKRLLAKCPDAAVLPAQFCLQMLSNENISLLPLSRLVSTVNAAISKPSVNDANKLDIASSSSSSASSSTMIVNPITVLRVCAPLFIKSLPWSESQHNHCSSLFKSAAAHSNLNIPDLVSPYRHLLLNLIASSIRSVRSFLHLTRICGFPICTTDADLNNETSDEFDAVDNMVLSWCYAMQSEFAASIEVPLGLAYVHLIQGAISHISSAALERAAKILLKLLSSYRISNASLIKAMVHLLVSLSPDQAKLLMQRPDKILLETESCRSATYDAIMTSSIESLNQCFGVIKPYTKKKLLITHQTFKDVQEAAVQSCTELERCLDLCNNLIAVDKDVLVSDRLISRLVSVINKLFTVGHSLIFVMSRLVTALDQDVLSEELEYLSEIDSCLVFIAKFVKSIQSISDWVNLHKESISSNLLSTTVFRISTFEHDVAAMVRKHRGSVASDRLDNIGDRLRRIADWQNKGSTNVSLKNRKRPRGGRKQQHRSRIAYIDEALLEEEGYASDAYADLEDWIVD